MADEPTYEYRVVRFGEDGEEEWAWPFASEAEARRFIEYNGLPRQRVLRRPIVPTPPWEDCDE